MRLGMVIDLTRCFGCNACTLACKQANATPVGIHFTKMELSETGKYPNAKQSYMSHICQHCENASCVEVCPTGASKKNPDGTVTVTAEECIGCESCVDACPYDARKLYERRQSYWGDKGETSDEAARADRYREETVLKCDFCQRRRQKGQLPACVETCPAVARIFGDLDDPNSEVSKLAKNAKPYKPEEGTKPNVFYIK